MFLLPRSLLKSFGHNGRRLFLLLSFLALVLIVMFITRGTKTDYYPFVEDVLLSHVKPTPGRTIFFLETRSHPSQLMNLTARQACAIESAALHNPNFQVFVIFTSSIYRDKGDAITDAILSYKNVQLRNLNLTTYATDTPIEDWVKKGDLFRSRYLIYHTSDLLRLISLYRFGGIYLDMDVVVLRSLENLSLNYVGIESSNSFGNAVIGLEPNGRGHEIGELFLRDFQDNYNGSLYIQNGPSLMGRVLTRICGTSNFTAMWEDPKLCKGIKVFNSTAFYALPWQKWRQYFEPQYMEQALSVTKDSYVAHIWNKVSSEERIKVGSRTAYGIYAEEHCPKAYAAAGDYF